MEAENLHWTDVLANILDSLYKIIFKYQPFSVTNICDEKNSWTIVLNFTTNTINITLVDGGQIANETQGLVYKGLSHYGPNWTLSGNSTVMIKYLGG